MSAVEMPFIDGHEAIVVEAGGIPFAGALGVGPSVGTGRADTR